MCDRETWSPFGTVTKPVLTGATETPVLATEAACEILRAPGGDSSAADDLEANLAQAQAAAAAALGD
ncbi:MAG: hypothetical protein A2289_04670 [Deltaproteobacteria bacterium RIFOXYA12_FULL_58_15]|nr:MAG: hypothetical protein A2289_04670 [Deltaproteobacteria bacterium RIFOXYA12_FULL_58_15]OGR09899.1 MAG: hypothetical protein A2341_27290 [Deltaproteobacteria bacterium RIFOXYB12_FULL_58_9]